MNAYEAWIATLPEEQRLFVQAIMAHVMLMVDDRFNELAGDIARVERRQGKNIGRVDELQLRLDYHEKRQWIAAKEAIEQFAAQQLPPERRDELIAKLNDVIARVEALEAKAQGDAGK